MPGKSQHGRGKYSARRGKKKGRRGSSIAAQRQTVVQAYKPVSQPKALAPSASIPAPIAAQTAAQYPYIGAELRRIGILAGIILAILVVLALVLPNLLPR